jgi:hypothetical protein
VFPIAGFTLGLIAKMLDVFAAADGVAGGSFSAAFSLACSSITLCANILARLEGRLSFVNWAVLVELAGVPNVNAADEVVGAVPGAATVAGSAFFFSVVAGAPKLNPAKGEDLAGALVAGRVGLNPAFILASEMSAPILSASSAVVDSGGSLNPPTAGKAGFGASDCGAPKEGLNPLVVADAVDVDDAGSLNPPVLATGGAGIANAGFGASVGFLLGGASLGEASIAVASRFLACAPFAVPAFPAFFVISSRYVLYSALTLSNADARLTKGSSRILTDKARTTDSFNPRTAVRYSISFWSSFGCSGFACEDAVGVGFLMDDEDDTTALGGTTDADGAPKADVVFVPDDPPNPPNADEVLVVAPAVDGAAAEASPLEVDVVGLKPNDANGFELALGLCSG